MKIFDDTIAAISTPIGTGGIGIIRISGSDSLKILGNIFSHKPNEFLSHHVYHGFIIGDEIYFQIGKDIYRYTSKSVEKIIQNGEIYGIYNNKSI